jgi:UDPglucose--hexose-1-phosphate uridylyltransferase
MAVSEFRQDLVSGSWVLISTGRSKRPHASDQEPKVHPPKEGCPFEDPQAAGNGEPLCVLSHGEELSTKDYKDKWTVQVIANKFPALQRGVCGPARINGPARVFDANGFHELVITRDHERSFAQFTSEETQEVLRAYRSRYEVISRDDCGAYVLIFHNHGPSAGASIYHNHSQIISTPILPPEILASIHGSEQFFKNYGTKVHDLLIEWELDQKIRIVYENEQFIAFCPFTSKSPYEIRIFPKISSARFELIDDKGIVQLADALNTIFRKLHKALGDPDYNFYIHTAPVAKDPSVSYDFYHWHIEIVPRIKIDAGFELATAISINSVDPDEAAQLLRETTV